MESYILISEMLVGGACIFELVKYNARPRTRAADKTDSTSGLSEFIVWWGNGC